MSPVVSGNEVIVHADAEVQGLLALLRSRTHPEGFRYELLITSVKDHGKTYDLTASLNTAFFDGGARPISVPGAEKMESPKESTSATKN